jgi:hypothetical protein
MGGYDADTYSTLAEAEVFDQKAHGWQPLPSMPTTRAAITPQLWSTV